MQNETNFNWEYSQFVSKNVTFYKQYYQTQETYIPLESIFVISMNSWSLPQNKVSFDLHLLAKFSIVKKYMPMISAILSEVEDTIFKRDLKLID